MEEALSLSTNKVHWNTEVKAETASSALTSAYAPKYLTIIVS